MVAKYATKLRMDKQTAFAEYRKREGLTLDATAEKFRVDRTTILRWERGDTLIPTKRLQEIEALTGISRHDLRPDIFGPAPSQGKAA